MRLNRRLSIGLLGALAAPSLIASAASQDNNIEWDGVFSDTTGNYVTPMEVTAGANVTLKLRVRSNDLTAAYGRLYYAGPNNVQRTAMTRATTGTLFDVWSVTLTIPTNATAVYYRFELQDGSDTDFYDAGDKADSWTVRGMTDTGRDDRDFMLVPGFATPDWSKRAVVYQIFPDRFSDGNPANNRLSPDDCFWYLDYAPACRDATCLEFEAQCAQFDVPDVPADYAKLCEVHEDWNEAPNGGPCDFFGGDLEGVEARLGYLQDLHVTAVYMNPVFRSMSNHKYDTMDFDAVDPRFGGTAALQRTTAAADSLGIKLIGDGVFNHGSDLGRFYNGWGNYAYDASAGTASGYDTYSSSCGAFEESFLSSQASNWSDCSSQWTDWFKIWTGTDVYDIDRDGNTSEPAAHTCGWAGLEFMPDFDYKAPSLSNSEARVWLYGGSSASSLSSARSSLAGKWLSDGAQMSTGLEGWRLDVPDNAGYFNTSSASDCSKTTNDASIWQGFRSAVKTIGTDKLIIGEIWKDASTHGGVDWFRSRTFDGVMNYHYFGMPMSCFITGLGVHNDASECTDEYSALSLNSSTSIDALDGHLATERRVYPASAYMSSHNILSSHDTSRFISRASGDAARLKEAWVFMATLPGAPVIYYGDEVGVAGANNEQGRATFPWDALEDAGSQESALRNFARGMMCMRRAYTALQTGSTVTLWTHNTQKTYVYARVDASTKMVVAINNSTSTQTVSPQVYRADLADGLVLVDALTNRAYTVSAGVVTLDLGAKSAAVLIPQGQELPAVNCVGDLPDAPVVDAGADEIVCAGDPVSLEGSAYDPDEEDALLSYAWYDGAGNVIATTPTTSVNGLSAGLYTYRLVVSDGLYEGEDSVTITIDEDCGGPTCKGESGAGIARYGLIIPVALAGLVIRRRRRTR